MDSPPRSWMLPVSTTPPCDEPIFGGGAHVAFAGLAAVGDGEHGCITVAGGRHTQR
ncbi:MAG: hypothetical protein U0694_22215 [Anaerolineae bacterium]